MHASCLESKIEYMHHLRELVKVFVEGILKKK